MSIGNNRASHMHPPPPSYHHINHATDDRSSSLLSLPCFAFRSVVFLLACFLAASGCQEAVRCPQGRRLEASCLLARPIVTVVARASDATRQTV